MEEKSVFETLNEIDVGEHVEQKNGLNYLSWAWAWTELKKRYPDAQYKVYENEQGWNYFTDGRTAWVKTGVIVNGLEHIEYLPIMDYTNKSIPLDKITSFNVNTAIQRSLTKAVARHGLGLYVYAGEDLPEPNDGSVNDKPKSDKPLQNAVNTALAVQAELNRAKKEENIDINIEKLAVYIHKKVEDITLDDVKDAIEKVRVRRNG